MKLLRPAALPAVLLLLLLGLPSAQPWGRGRRKGACPRAQGARGRRGGAPFGAVPGTCWRRCPATTPRRPQLTLWPLPQLCRSLDIARSFYTSALSSSYLCAIVTEVARRTASVASTTAGGSVWSPGSAWTEVRAPHSPNSRPRAAPGMFPKNKVSWH